MKKIILKFWLINFLLCILLFVIYIILITKTNYTDEMSVFKKILFVINVLFNLWVSTISLIAMAFCSLFFFLNLIEKIRNNYFLSFLSFLGIPTIWLICLIVINVKTGFTIYTTILILAIIYLFLTTIEFLKFRKKLKIHLL